MVHEDINAHQRSIEVAEGLFAKDGRDFSRDAAGLGVFMDHQNFVGLFHRLQNCLFVEREQRAQVNHFGFDAFLGQRFGGF